ncbi:signal peptidase I [Fictibacillus phosphorivorans]|uniref:signal peptidase I n=1 Tax=Fictibacillus phosphorivorans TaxID=1221500 RepID=UPI00203E4B28|nr:signal peptidase I [Fictibacillus phosphorivorans]MCM3717674.1 signal peptidase I [Fictibacillus phosphorivorans]MCM3775574.1 signal peptidase I [Fictibacillus phosphorivorans]
MHKRIFKILTSIMMFVMVVSIGFLLYTSYQASKNPDQIPSIFGYKPLTVLSNSMQPAFTAGDLVLVKEKPASEIAVNDVITFKKSDRKLITHRVIGKMKNGFVTKGDSNNVKDSEIVAAENVIGTHVFTIPKAGYVSKFVSSPWGITLLILIPLLSYLLLEIYDLLSRVLSRKEKAV